MSILKYISHYPQQVKERVLQLEAKNKLADYLLSQYPATHSYLNDECLTLFYSATALRVSVNNQKRHP